MPPYTVTPPCHWPPAPPPVPSHALTSPPSPPSNTPGIDINKADADGWTPLYQAAKVGNIAAVEALLAAGADARVVIWGVPNKDAFMLFVELGDTALSVASGFSWAWADVNIKDSSRCIRALLAATQPQGSLAARCLAAPERLLYRSLALLADLLPHGGGCHPCVRQRGGLFAGGHVTHPATAVLAAGTPRGEAPLVPALLLLWTILSGPRSGVKFVLLMWIQMWVLSAFLSF